MVPKKYLNVAERQRAYRQRVNARLASTRDGVDVAELEARLDRARRLTSLALKGLRAAVLVEIGSDNEAKILRQAINGALVNFQQVTDAKTD